MTSCAPIALFVYNRPDHASRTLDALRSNSLAPDTDLFIFSDGAKNAADEPHVDAVRDILKDVRGFKSVSVDRSGQNKGLAQSIIGGVSNIVDRFGRVIVIEDDLVTHPSTLSYFNQALDHFENHPNVFSISAYNHPADIMPIPQSYEYDVYANPRMQCWGWATWKDRWQKADFSMPDFEEFDRSETLTRAYAHWIGQDSLNTLRAHMRGELDVWACRWVYTHFKHQGVCICPTKSLVDNIGLDGSGENCSSVTHLKNELTADKTASWRFPPVAFIEPAIFTAFMDVTDPGTRRVPANGLTVHNQAASAGPGLAERFAYWSAHPGKFLRRLPEKGAEYLAGLSGRSTHFSKASLQRAHQELSAPPTVPLVRLGTEYGGWHVPQTGLGPSDVVVSAGAGEDISFDMELAERFGCRIVLLDPTPRAFDHFSETSASIRSGRAAAINGSSTEFYRANPKNLDHLTFQPWGLWRETTRLQFFEPENPTHVSHSIGNLHQTEKGFEAECVSLSDLMAREDVSKVSVLKMDIEGAEFDVLDQMLTTKIRPTFLLVEFHPGKDAQERTYRGRTLQTLRRLYDEGYRLVQYSGWDYVLERQVI